MDFWDRLREKIKERGLTQYRIAKKLNVPVGTFKNWLSRQTYPDAQKIVEIAKMLGTSAEYLMTGDDVSKRFTAGSRSPKELHDYIEDLCRREFHGEITFYFEKGVIGNVRETARLGRSDIVKRYNGVSQGKKTVTVLLHREKA
jgi:transcriptional regulator with XRE-family HTH domain